MGDRYDADAFGRISEASARVLGTGRFLAGQTVLVIGWIALNAAGFVRHWDPYPFILLNLAFSTQAAYAAPLILLAQNRQDDRDRVNLDEDRSQARKATADAEYLAREIAAIRIALGEVATRDYLRSELSRLERSDDKDSHRDGQRERDREKSKEKAKEKAREKERAGSPDAAEAGSDR
jgi:uncharacterized membrane protein